MMNDEFGRPKTIFRTLRRLHCHNLDSSGLNDLTEAFESFMTRARYFSATLRRTWSHSAIEFMRYRRRLPALVAASDRERAEHSSFREDRQSTSRTLPRSSLPRAKNDEENDELLTSQSLLNVKEDAEESDKVDLRKIFVSNISYRVTTTQLASFFSKFGRIKHCIMPAEQRVVRHRARGIGYVTFVDVESAEKAKNASPTELVFYDRTMMVTQALPAAGKPKRQVSRELSSSKASLDATDSESVLSSPSFTDESVEGTETSRHILALKDSELIRIFEQLSIIDRVRIERVCKRFLELSMKSWCSTQRLGFHGLFSIFRGRVMRNPTLKAILHRCGHYVDFLDLSGAPQFLDEHSLQIVATACPRLQGIDLTGLKVRWQAIKTFAECCSKLRRIVVHNSYALSEKAFWWLFRNMHQLQHVDASGCTRLNGKCFHQLGSALEEAIFNNCTRLEPIGIEELCRKCANLRVLQLSGCAMLTDECLSHICRLSHLQILNLANVSIGVPALGQIHTLVELSLCNNTSLSDKILIAIAEGCPQLTVLNLSGAGPKTAEFGNGILTEAGFLALCVGAANLMDADFSYHGQVKDDHIATLAKHGRLRTLKLRGCSSISDEIASPLIAHCAKLAEVDLSSCLRFSNHGIRAFVSGLKARQQQSAGGSTVTVVTGGTSCQPSQLDVKGSRLVLDASDYTNPFLLPGHAAAEGGGSDYEASEDDGSDDDEFDTLSISRSYVLGGIDEDDDSVNEIEEAEEEVEARAVSMPPLDLD